MPLFKILPLDQSFASAEIFADNVGDALDKSRTLACSEADVLEDEKYIFSIRRMRSAGFWTIFQRDASEITPPLRSVD